MSLRTTTTTTKKTSLFKNRNIFLGSFVYQESYICDLIGMATSITWSTELSQVVT